MSNDFERKDNPFKGQQTNQEEQPSQQEKIQIESTEDERKTVKDIDEIENENPSVYYVSKIDNGRPARKRRGLLSYFTVALVAAVIGGLVSGYVFPMYLYGKVLPVPEVYRENIIGENSQINITPKDDINLVTAVAKKATKSVVGITTVTVENYFFWGPREVQGVGSGVIVNSDGYILTNSHVVGDGRADKITVQFENGKQKKGTVLWNDSALDLAIVKVDAKNLPAAELGDSDKLQVGELVVAIGNPLSLALERTVTSGIISGLNRTIRDENNVIEDLIQTDASINPGNSGGPLLNAKGEVIGINTAKITSAEGLGFALPINLAKPIIEQVIKEGKFKTVYIGIVGVEVETYEKKLGIDLSADEGVIIIEIMPDSPALYAGLHAGDVIIELDGEKVDSMNTLRKMLYKYKPGDKAKILVIRNGEKKEINITFKQSPDNY